MKNNGFLLVVLLFLAVFQCSFSWAFPLKKNNKLLFRSVISSGGCHAKGGIFSLNDVKGQPCLITSSAGAGINLSHGYFFSPANMYLQSIFSLIQYPANYSFVETLSSIQGQAYSYSVLKTTRISVQRLSDNYFFNGSSWSASEEWMDSVGTEKWMFPVKDGVLDYGVSYKICSKAYDISGAEESPGKESVFTYVFSTNIANSVAAYPNPFLPGQGGELIFEYFLSAACPVQICIYSICGDVVKHYQGDAYESPGLHHVKWDGKNEKGYIVANGVYLFAVQAGHFKKTEKVIVLK